MKQEGMSEVKGQTWFARHGLPLAVGAILVVGVVLARAALTVPLPPALHTAPATDEQWMEPMAPLPTALHAVPNADAGSAQPVLTPSLPAIYTAQGELVED
jgi:hypothetical protein